MNYVNLCLHNNLKFNQLCNVFPQDQNIALERGNLGKHLKLLNYSKIRKTDFSLKPVPMMAKYIQTLWNSRCLWIGQVYWLNQILMLLKNYWQKIENLMLLKLVCQWNGKSQRCHSTWPVIVLKIKMHLPTWFNCTFYQGGRNWVSRVCICIPMFWGFYIIKIGIFTIFYKKKFFAI